MPPPAERFKEIVRAVGGAAKDAGRVEVPFSCIIPAGERMVDRRQPRPASTCPWAGPGP